MLKQKAQTSLSYFKHFKVARKNTWPFNELLKLWWQTSSSWDKIILLDLFLTVKEFKTSFGALLSLRRCCHRAYRGINIHSVAHLSQSFVMCRGKLLYICWVQLACCGALWVKQNHMCFSSRLNCWMSLVPVSVHLWSLPQALTLGISCSFAVLGEFIIVGHPTDMDPVFVNIHCWKRTAGRKALRDKISLLLCMLLG